MARRDPSRKGPGDDARPRAVSWFPGHMVKAQRRLASELGGVDVVLEVRDARLPLGSANPELARLVGERPRLVLLNKERLADPALTKRWSEWFARGDLPHLFLDAGSGAGVQRIVPVLERLTEPLRRRFERRGMRPPLPRLMVIGFPNVGKTTLINRLAGRKRLRTAPEPGVTRGVTWVTLTGRFELMDSPGVMLPRLDDEPTLLRLGWIATLRDHLVGEERLAAALVEFLLRHYPDALPARYGVQPDPQAGPHDVLDAIARRRGMVRGDGEPDRRHVGIALLHDFRAGRLGRITLETPPAEQQRPARDH